MRFALRSLRHRPAFAVAAILTIALGVGANMALFSVVYGVLIQPLPFRDPAKLIRIWETHPALPQLQAAMPDFRDWRNQTRSFDAMSAHTASAMNIVTLLGQGQPEIVQGTMATSDLFSTMGIQTLVGRKLQRRRRTGEAASGCNQRRLVAAEVLGRPRDCGQANSSR
jgi:hypothetical protein